jgi:hypothetical protein
MASDQTHAGAMVPVQYSAVRKSPLLSKRVGAHAHSKTGAVDFELAQGFPASRRWKAQFFAAFEPDLMREILFSKTTHIPLVTLYKLAAFRQSIRISTDVSSEDCSPRLHPAIMTVIHVVVLKAAAKAEPSALKGVGTDW